MNNKVDLFNRVNALLHYDEDPLGVTWWWCEDNAWFGGWKTKEGSEYYSPLIILATKVPNEVTPGEFIQCVLDNIEDMRAM